MRSNFREIVERDPYEWREWFAWYPVRLWTGMKTYRWVWWEKVKYRLRMSKVVGNGAESWSVYVDGNRNNRSHFDYQDGEPPP